MKGTYYKKSLIQIVQIGNIFMRKIYPLLIIVFTVDQVSAETLIISTEQIESSSFVQLEASDSANLALVATASTSYVSSWETIDAVNDGYTPSNSNDKSKGAYGNWDSPNTFQWVQYTWGQEFILNSIEIYWFDDAGGVLTPDIAFIQFYENDSWEILDSVPVPCIKNVFNYADLADVTTDRIRVTMKNESKSTGILEFRVWGTGLTGSNDIERPTSPDKIVVNEKYIDGVEISWGTSTDNIGVTGYQVYINDTLNTETTDTGLTIAGLDPDYLYFISVKAIDKAGNKSASTGSVWLSVGDEAQIGKAFNWPEYSPSIHYNFKDEFPALEMPTQDLDDCPEVVGTQSDGWWTYKWGPNAKSVVTEAAITPMLERMNKDFAYFRDTMGWPPDKRAKNGYRSAIYLFGSGLCTDDKDSTALGGWQGSIYHEGESWPMVLLSYYPVYSFDPACNYSDRENQMGAVVHEGIHAVLADLPGVKQAAWFHEGGNTWLQQEAYARQSQNYSSMGFLNGCTFIAPFMPVECYSGWLQDDSFGGPSAEGVNMYDGGQQLCTWRKYLGGNQYGNAFPTFVSQVFGPGSIAWIWRNCPGRVLEGMGDTLGDMQIRRLIIEYKAKQALIDMGEWSNAIRNIVNSNFNTSLGAEWSPSWMQPEIWKATPYARTRYDSTLDALVPEYRTTPGWSGANQIPLNVKGMGDTVIVNFMPVGANMTCQLCYRAEDGTPVYGKPVSEGECILYLDKKPANDVVIAVITNSDYVYEGEETRKAHFDYRLQLVKGIYKKASVYRKWYNYETDITDVDDPVWWETETETGTDPDPDPDPDTDTTTATESKHMVSDLLLYPNPANTSDRIHILFSEQVLGNKQVRLINGQGSNVCFVSLENEEQDLDLDVTNLASGIYFIIVQSENQHFVERIIIE